MFRVVICDDDPFFRDFFRMLLAQQGDFTVVAEGASGADAVSLCKEHRPDLLLVDVQMDSPAAGIDAIRAIRSFDSEVRIIVLTVYGSDKYIIGSFRNGADGFLQKDQAVPEIMKTIRDVLAGKVRISQDVAQALKSYISQTGQREQLAEANYRQCMEIQSMLTRSELEILLLLRRGYTREAIAKKKVIELSTIKTHINRILKKFNARRTSAVLKKLDEIDFFRYVSEGKEDL